MLLGNGNVAVVGCRCGWVVGVGWGLGGEGGGWWNSMLYDVHSVVCA